MERPSKLSYRKKQTADQWAIMTLLCIDATSDANVFVSAGDGVSVD